MIVSAAVGWLSFRRFSGNRTLRMGFIFGLAVITISIPIHLRSLVVWSTDYIVTFSPWYSVAEIPMFLALAYVITRLRIRRG